MSKVWGRKFRSLHFITYWVMSWAWSRALFGEIQPFQVELSSIPSKASRLVGFGGRFSGSMLHSLVTWMIGCQLAAEWVVDCYIAAEWVAAERCLSATTRDAIDEELLIEKRFKNRKTGNPYHLQQSSWDMSKTTNIPNNSLVSLRQFLYQDFASCEADYETKSGGLGCNEKNSTWVQDFFPHVLIVQNCIIRTITSNSSSPSTAMSLTCEKGKSHFGWLRIIGCIMSVNCTWGADWQRGSKDINQIRASHVQRRFQANPVD